MIEQTELVVTKWTYNPPTDTSVGEKKIISSLEFDIMKKRNSVKKGILCRFTAEFEIGNEQVLIYVGEDSYVMDFEDVVDKNELQTMIRNSYSKFNEAFEFRKLSTVLHSNYVKPFDESIIDYDVLVHFVSFV
ncbi:MAG: hypothetical protein HY840_03325 [Bacteroidetes bacterium]|nr:hypothetical protein [Bacteroidota bacterium]